MGFRFRKSFKVGGVRLNVGKRGLSTTIGPRGASVNIGRRGVYANTGIPGTGIGFRSKLGGGSNKRTGNRLNSTSAPTKQYQSIAVKFILDDETGETHWTDANGQPLSDEFIAIAKKQNREKIVEMLDGESEKFNNKLDGLLRIHLETPTPDTIISYTPVVFTEKIPLAPDKSRYIGKIPSPPKLKSHNFITKRIGFLGNRLEESNKKQKLKHEQLLAEANLIQQELDRNLVKDCQKYEADLAQWQRDKESFEQEQGRLKHYVDVERLTEVDAMQDFLEEHLEAIDWPLETNVSFEVDSCGKQVWIDVDLPEIEMMPCKVAKVNHTKLNLTVSDLSKTQQQQNYLTHIHAIGFRLIGETFVALPSAQEVILSGYSQRISRRTGHVENEYLYSVKVQRNLWEKINFLQLDALHVVDCYEMFELRRKMSKSGLITPIEPFKLETTPK